MRRFWMMMWLAGTAVMLAEPAHAQLTSEHRRQLLEISRSLTKVATHVRKKEFAEAEQILAEAETEVEQMAAAAMVDKTDRGLAGVLKAIERQRAILVRAQGGNEGVSFVEDVAPLITARCLSCHAGANPRSGLNLETFAGWKRGGRSGALLAPGNASRSLLMARLSAPQDKGGMPQRGEMLSRDELETIARWIGSGAKFDGSSDRKPLGDLIFEHELKTASVVIPKPKGSETVSFTRDIAPWFQNMCVRCHNEQRRSGGLSLVSFYDMMRGGDSGQVILPGDMENSRLFRLVGGLENPRMPNDNQVRITRKNYEDLKQWFKEGNTYDGSDPRTPLAAFVKSPEELERERFARMTDEEFRKFRKERTEQQFQRALPNDPAIVLAGDDLLFIGNVSEARLRQVQGWADELLGELVPALGDGEHPWRGRLAVFVLKDRFSYDEFRLVVEQREPVRELQGHSRVTPTHEDAYVVLLDVGDAAVEGSPGTKAQLTSQLTGALIRSRGSGLPEWLVQGTGLAMAASAQPALPYFRELRGTAENAVRTLSNPADVFRDGAVEPASLGAVGFTLVDHLIDSAGRPKLKQLIRALQQGQSLDESLRRVYGSSPAAIAQSYFQNLGRKR